jgi:magnesium-protoporphyrin O-methyltransferase
VGCCSAKGCEQFFSERVARRDARRYRKKGLDANARRVVEFLRDHGLQGRTVLEVGGGVGSIQLELLRAGAERAVNVELSPAYERPAGDLLVAAGLQERAERRVLDFAAHPGEVEAADFVVMHKVVCCYPDYRALVAPAANKAREALVLTLPADRRWVRLGAKLVNLVERLRGHEFRTFVHDPEAVLEVAGREGLALAREENGPIWRFAGLTRGG